IPGTSTKETRPCAACHEAARKTPPFQALPVIPRASPYSNNFLLSFRHVPYHTWPSNRLYALIEHGHLRCSEFHGRCGRARTSLSVLPSSHIEPRTTESSSPPVSDPVP